MSSHRKIALGPLRPHLAASKSTVLAAFEAALARADGNDAAQCIHELWMRGEIGVNVDRALQRLWREAGSSIPDWLPMRHVEWLPLLYQVTARCRPAVRGSSNIYLVLLDYADREQGPYGVYVGMTGYSPAERFDQHKAGIRAAGSVLKRGLEVLTGPAAHLQRISRAEAVRIESELAEALRAAGLLVRGGH